MESGDGGGSVLELQHGGVDLPRGDAAERKVGGEFGAEVEIEEAVAGGFVARHGTSCEEVDDALVGVAGAAVEWIG